LLDTKKLSAELFNFFENNKNFAYTQEKFYDDLISSYERLSNSFEQFLDVVNTKSIPFLFALPYDDLRDFQKVSNCSDYYRVGSVDGSQIEDLNYFMWNRNEFLINVGSIIIDYENFFIPYHESKPKIFDSNAIKELFREDFAELSQYSKSDLISSVRTYYEYDEAIRLVDFIKREDLLLMDGGLVQWHLQDKPVELKNIVVNKISELLNKADSNGVHLLGYISGSRASDVVNCLKIHNCKDNLFRCISCRNEFCKFLESINDSTLFTLVYPPLDENKLILTPIFQSRARITSTYGVPIYFFYIYNENEFARVEFSKNSIGNVSSFSMKLKDQIDKGFGYPIALTEAHESAVVSECDKINFERIVESMSSQFEVSFKKRSKVLSKKLKFI